MVVNFAKSLDRPVDIFGIKGKWLTIFLVAAGLSVLIAVVVGFCTTSGVGIASAILLVVSSFVGCLTMQGKVSYRQVGKARAASKIPSCVTRRETLCRILLPDPQADDQDNKEGRQ